MNKYRMIITPESPICIAQKRGTGNFIETFDYIPGSTIRGALAMLYITQYGSFKDGLWRITDASRQSEFDSIFNCAETRFGNCYPGGARVIPFTASSCKYHPGFYNPRGESHGVLDTLIENARYESRPNYSISSKYDNCDYGEKECLSVMDRFEGYYHKEKNDCKFIKAFKRLISHTAIMESTETAIPAYLYTMEVLNEKANNGEPQYFMGVFETCGEPDILLELLGQNNTIYIGTGKSRGLGKGKIRLIKENETYTGLSLFQRFKILNERIDVPGRFFFSVTLDSDAILLDEILNYKAKIDTWDLTETLEGITDCLKPNDINIFKEAISQFHHLRNWTSTYLLSGWNMAHRLPKEDGIAVSKGSVFLFSTDNSPSENQKDNVIRMLTLIEQAGVGERRNEGFGRISICDEFHLEEIIK